MDHNFGHKLNSFCEKFAGEKTTFYLSGISQNADRLTSKIQKMLTS